MSKLPPSRTALVNDPAREATDTMRGYSYQVLRSVLVWIELGDDEILYLEGAEDLDRISGDPCGPRTDQGHSALWERNIA